MKKILKKLKSVNKQIAEFENELVNINAWTEHTSYDRSEKKRQIESHEHFIDELKETKLDILKALKDAVEQEIDALTPSTSKVLMQHNNSLMQKHLASVQEVIHDDVPTIAVYTNPNDPIFLKQLSDL
jgi:DNA repair exonuclease SbcCD ATPase subunit